MGQTEVGEAREGAGGSSSSMAAQGQPHPVRAGRLRRPAAAGARRRPRRLRDRRAGAPLRCLARRVAAAAVHAAARRGCGGAHVDVPAGGGVRPRGDAAQPGLAARRAGQGRGLGRDADRARRRAGSTGFSPSTRRSSDERRTRPPGRRAAGRSGRLAGALAGHHLGDVGPAGGGPRRLLPGGPLRHPRARPLPGARRGRTRSPTWPPTSWRSPTRWSSTVRRSSGLSLGGAIGQALALSHPSRLTAAVLCCTLPSFGDPATWAERAAAGTHVRHGPRSPSRPRAAGSPTAFRAEHPDEVERFVAMITGIDAGGLRRPAARRWPGSTPGPRWDASRCRCGWWPAPRTRSPCRTPAPTMAATIPGADLVVIEDASHIASAAQPERVQPRCTEHLERHL